jgi:hypothetical protein
MSAADLVYGVLGKGEIEKAIAGSVTIRAALMEKAGHVQSFWVDYWNELPHPWSRGHTLKSGYVEEPDDYANSIRIYYLRSRSGMMKARVWAKDFKAHWIEYGAAAHMSGWPPLHMTGGMPEFAPRQHTLEEFGGGGDVDVVSAD